VAAGGSAAARFSSRGSDRLASAIAAAAVRMREPLISVRVFIGP
jgi:hypothetical protein